MRVERSGLLFGRAFYDFFAFDNSKGITAGEEVLEDHEVVSGFRLLAHRIGRVADDGHPFLAGYGSTDFVA